MTPVEEIKSKVDIVAFLKGYLDVHPAGKNWKARCPFHGEKTPSFMISPERNGWHCFGCGKGGDVFTFVMEHDHLEFYEALTFLAEKTGVALTGAGRAEQRQLDVLFEVNEAARDFFVESLAKTSEAQEYLRARKLAEETQREFGIGWAPVGTDDCIKACIGHGHAIRDIVRAGIAIPGDRGGYYDRFRGRIMFPIYTHIGKIAGFTGRILRDGDSDAKYVNTPETPVFKKSKILYGFHKSKEHIRAARSAFLVEGQMDFLMAWQDGMKTAVATSGTAVTPDHLAVLRRYADEIVIGFDNDGAGWAAGERVCGMAHGMDLTTRIIRLPDGAKDPADVAANTPGVLRELVEHADPSLRLFFKKYPLDQNPTKSKGNVRILLAAVRRLASPIDRGYWTRELSVASGIPEEDLRAEYEALPPEQGAEPAPASHTSPLSDDERRLTRLSRIAEHLIGACLATDRLAELRASEYAQYLPNRQRAVLDALGSDAPQNPEIAAYASRLSERAGLDELHSIEDLQTELKEEYRGARVRLATRAVRQADLDNDDEEVDRLFRTISELKAEPRPPAQN